jgi:hypothetical protein
LGFVNDQRESQIELFLNCERPGGYEKYFPFVVGCDPEIIGEREIGVPRQRLLKVSVESFVSRPTEEPEETVNGKDHHVERNDSEEAPSIERFEIVLGTSLVDKNPADQKSGQHEKQIDTKPATRGGGTQETGEIYLLAKVNGNDSCDSEPAQAVELRDMALNTGAFHEASRVAESLRLDGDTGHGPM